MHKLYNRRGVRCTNKTHKESGKLCTLLIAAPLFEFFRAASGEYLDEHHVHATSLRFLAGCFVARGMAALIYDKRRGSLGRRLAEFFLSEPGCEYRRSHRLPEQTAGNRSLRFGG